MPRELDFFEISLEWILQCLIKIRLMLLGFPSPLPEGSFLQIWSPLRLLKFCKIWLE